MNISDIVTFDDFLKIQIHAGTIIKATLNTNADRPAYILKIDFGEYGFKTSSAQITKHYQPSQLIGQQILAVMNFPPIQVGEVESEVLVLACVTEEDGTILLQPTHHVPNGSRVV